MIITRFPDRYTIALVQGPDFRHHLAMLKSLPGKQWQPEPRYYVIPASAAPVVEQIAEELSVVIKDGTKPAGAEEENTPALPVYSIALGKDAPGQPRPYQLEGIQKGLHLRRFINGDEQGLGKSLQASLTMASAQANGFSAFPVLIICPASLKENWKREWEMWTGKKAMILNDSVKDAWPVYFNTGMVQAFIVNYESLVKFFALAAPNRKRKSAEIELKANTQLFRAVIIDESHRCKDPGTIQSKMALRLCVGKEWVNLLTGTPVKNRPAELYPQLAIMNRLGAFGGRAGFLKDYCAKDASLHGLNKKLQQLCYFRREKKDVAKDLPDKQRQQIVCEISTADEYREASQQFLQWLKKSGATLEQITTAQRAEVLVQMNKLRAISARGKMEETRQFIQEVLDSGEKLIVFHNLKEVGQAIVKMFPGAVTINGANTTETRQANVDAFQKSLSVKLIVCNIQAAGVGITLTASSRVLFVEFPWTYADLVQCEDRAHRIGQKNSVMCTYLLGKGTIDEQLFEAIIRKKDIHSQVTGATDALDVATVDTVLKNFLNG